MRAALNLYVICAWWHWAGQVESLDVSRSDCGERRAFPGRDVRAGRSSSPGPVRLGSTYARSAVSTALRVGGGSARAEYTPPWCPFGRRRAERVHKGVADAPIHGRRPLSRKRIPVARDANSRFRWTYRCTCRARRWRRRRGWHQGRSQNGPEGATPRVVRSHETEGGVGRVWPTTAEQAPLSAAPTARPCRRWPCHLEPHAHNRPPGNSRQGQGGERSAPRLRRVQRIDGRV